MSFNAGLPGKSQRGGLFLKIIFSKKIEFLFIYSVVLVSGVLQNDSVVYTYTFFFIFFSIIVFYKILNIVPSAIL